MSSQTLSSEQIDSSILLTINESLTSEKNKIGFIVSSLKRKLDFANEEAKRCKINYDIWSEKFQYISKCLGPELDSDSDSELDSDSEPGPKNNEEFVINLIEDFLKTKKDFKKIQNIPDELDNYYCKNSKFCSFITHYKELSKKEQRIFLSKPIKRRGRIPNCQICNDEILGDFHRIGHQKKKRKCTHPECMTWLINKVVE